MNEAEWPYPPREHLERAVDMVGVLKQELDTYPDGNSLREARHWLVPTYGKSPFARALQRYAWVLQHAHTFRPPPHYDPDQTVAMSFYMGALMGMHCFMRPLSWDERRALLGWDFMDLDSIEDDTQKMQYLSTVGKVALHAEECAYAVLAQQPREAQELTLTAAVRTFEGMPYASSRENEYVFGFVFTGVTVGRGLQRFNGQQPMLN